MANVDIRLGHKNTSWFTTNSTLVLKDGQMVVCSDGANQGKYKIGDGTIQLSALTFYGGVSVSPAWGSITGTLSSQTDLQTALNGKQNTITTGTTAQYLRGDLSLATFPTNVSSFTNDSGYITSSALSPYLTIANAALTYQPIGSYLTGLTVGSTVIGSGTNTRILYNNAGVLGEYAVTGTGTTAVLSTSPTFTTNITTPSVIGGTANGSFITYKSTTGAGTSSNLAHSFIGGTNGGTTLFNLYNDGQVITGGGTIRNPTTFGNFRIAQSTSLIDMGFIAANQAAIWIQKTTPSSTNYTITADAATTIFNGVDSLIFSTGGTERFRVNRAQTSGSLSTFTWSSASNTGQTASTNIPGFLFTTGSRQWNTGAISLQTEFSITAPTYSFVGASTITNAYTLFVNSPIAGTNATITNSWSIGTNGNLLSQGSLVSSSPSGGVGYFTGAGSTVTQITSRTTGVTINNVCGAITLVSAAGSTTWQSFTVTNSRVASTDVIIVNQDSGTDLYQIFVTNVAAGSFRITFATTGGTTTEQPVFNFSIIKAVTA